MKIDTHLHSVYSFDSTIKTEELVKKAIERNYKYICFTDHFDLLPQELSKYGILSLKRYKTEIDSLRDKFPQIKIGFGLEMGEMHRTRELREKILYGIKLDYIIGSIHLLRNEKNLSTPINFSLQDSDIMLYYLETLEMIEKGGFDTLGHLDIFKRELQTSIKQHEYIQELLDDILLSLIKREICLEVNYSGFRSSCNHTLPDFPILTRYKNLGGELITIGSDSHRIDFFDKYYDKTVCLLKDAQFDKIFYKYDNKWIENKI